MAPMSLEPIVLTVAAEAAEAVPLWVVGAAVSPFAAACVALWRRNNKLEDRAHEHDRETITVLAEFRDAALREAEAFDELLRMAR